MMNYSAEVLGEMEQHDCVKAWFSLNLSVSIILSGVVDETIIRIGSS